jgi:ABC-type glycerol-3-phosphate transport system substrate-binding protein
VTDIVINRTKYSQNGCLGDGTSEMISYFANQETAMMINGSWQMATLNAANLDFEYAVFPFPAKEEENTKVMSNADFSLVISAQSSPEKQEAAKTFLEYVLTEGAKYYIEQSASPSALKAIAADTSRYQAIVPYLESGDIFRMPYSGRWTDDTYLDYTVALQNLVDTSNKEQFYDEFTDALLVSGKPKTYID